MSTSPAPAIPRPRRPLTHLDRALLRAVAAGRCALTPGPLPSLLVDGHPVCDQRAAYQLVTSGYLADTHDRATLTAAGEDALRRSGEAG